MLGRHTERISQRVHQELSIREILAAVLGVDVGDDGSVHHALSQRRELVFRVLWSGYLPHESVGLILPGVGRSSRPILGGGTYFDGDVSGPTNFGKRCAFLVCTGFARVLLKNCLWDSHTTQD